MKSTYYQALRVWLLPGLIAGLLFLGIALMAGTLTTSTWAMPDAIAHTLGLSAPPDYSFALVPVIVGITVHLGLSIALGAVLAAIASWWQLQGWRLLVAGVLLIGCETPIALWGVLHPLLPIITFHYYLAAVPLWGSVLGHVLYALTLSLLLLVQSPLAMAPRAASEHGRAG
jgi:hypothetical protein